jgi:hypothetical protein
VPLAALALMLTSSVEAALLCNTNNPTSCDFHCVREPYPGSVFYLTGGYNPDSMNPDECRSSCAAIDMELAGITNGQVCLCGKETLTDCKGKRALAVYNTTKIDKICLSILSNSILFVPIGNRLRTIRIKKATTATKATTTTITIIAAATTTTTTIAAATAAAITMTPTFPLLSLTLNLNF